MITDTRSKKCSPDGCLKGLVASKRMSTPFPCCRKNGKNHCATDRGFPVNAKRDKINKLTSLPKCSFIAQLVEHRNGIAEVTGSNPVEALLLSNCLNWKINCDDHSSLSSTTAVQI